MEKEISTGTLLVIVLVALAAIIGMGFAVFSIARGSANDGNQALTEQTSYASSSWSSIYNDGEVTGKQLETLVTKEADSKNISVFVCTRGFNNKAPISHEAPILMYNQNCYINYGIVYDYTDDYYSYRSGTIVYEGESALFTVRDASSLKTSYLPKLENGKIVKNLDFSDVTANGTGGYIDLHAKFRCNLIYGADGEVCGVIARQVNKPTAVTTNKEALATGVTGIGAIVNSYSNNSSNIPLTSASGGKPVDVETKGGVTIITSTTIPGGGIGTVGTGTDVRTEEIKESASAELATEDLEIFKFSASNPSNLTGISITEAYYNKYGSDIVIQIPDKFTSMNSYLNVIDNYDCIDKIILSPTMTSVRISESLTYTCLEKDIVIEIPGTMISFELDFYDEFCDFILPYHCEGGVKYDPWSIPEAIAEAWKDEHITCFDCGCTACGAATGKGEPYVWLWSGTTIIGFTGTLSGDVEIPSGCTALGDRALCNVNVDSLTFPSTCTSIGGECMMGANIGKLNLTKGLTKLYSYAFQDCTIGGDSIVIPDTVIQMDSSAFSGAIVPDLFVVEHLRSGMYFPTGNSGMSGVKTLKINKSSINYIPNSYVTWAKSNAGVYHTAGYDGLEELIYPSSIKSVQQMSYNAAKIGTLSLPDTQTILYSNRYHKGSFTNIDWPSALLTLNSYSLAHIGMSELKIPNGVKTLSSNWASELDSIVETLIIPPSVTASSNNAYHTKAGVLLKAPAHLQNYESKLTNSNNTSNKPTLKYYSCGCSTCINKSSYVTVENPY